MFGISNHQPAPPSAQPQPVQPDIEVEADIPPNSAIDAVYALLNIIADPAAALQRMDDLDARIDTLVMMTEQLDAREANILGRENAADEREHALLGREKVLADIKELAASADVRIEIATQAEESLIEKQQQDAVAFEQISSDLKNKDAALTARSNQIRALEIDLSARTAAIDTRERDVNDRIAQMQKIVSRS